MTPSYEALRELVERVERATGPDRELDLLIGRHVAGLTPPSDSDPLRRWSGPGVAFLGAVPTYTSSLDAITALIERVLPEWQIEQISWEPVRGGKCIAAIGNFGAGEAYRCAMNKYPKPPALACCEALLRAKLEPGE